METRFWLTTEGGTSDQLQQKGVKSNTQEVQLSTSFACGRKTHLSSLETVIFRGDSCYTDLSIFPQTGVVGSVFGFVAFVALHMVAELSFCHDA